MVGETIVVTRPQGDERALTDLLHAHGYRVIHEPLTQILLRHDERHAVAKALYDEPDACIITSRHGAQALALLTEVRDIFLICVGDATARMASSLGFARIDVAGGNAKKLTDYILGSYEEDSRLLYVSGEHVSTDIVSPLQKVGMKVERIPIYEAVASERLSDTIVEQLRREQLDAVTFLSQRTAHIFTSLIEKAGVQNSVAHLHGFALSAAITEPLVAHPWKKLHVTDEATLASLIESVDNAFQR